MFSYFSMMLGPFVSAVKAWILLLAIVIVGSYIGYLHWQLSWSQSELDRLQVVATECQLTAHELTVQNEIQADSLERLKAYYRDKKCLDLRDGELSDEELKLQ